MIWLQKNVSLIFWTTQIDLMNKAMELWFGYKKMYLWYSEQQQYVDETGKVVVIWLQKNVSLIFWTTVNQKQRLGISCDLVTKKCIFDILNNW